MSDALVRIGGLQCGEAIVQVELLGERFAQVLVIVNQQDRLVTCHGRLLISVVAVYCGCCQMPYDFA